MSLINGARRKSTRSKSGQSPEIRLEGQEAESGSPGEFPTVSVERRRSMSDPEISATEIEKLTGGESPVVPVTPRPLVSTVPEEPIVKGDDAGSSCSSDYQLSAQLQDKLQMRHSA